MLNDYKIKIIQDAEPVLKVDSRFIKPKPIVLNRYRFAGALILLFYIGHSFYNSNDYFLLLFNLVICVPILLLLTAFTKGRANTGNPFVLTEKGILMLPYLVELWEDLDGYQFVEYSSAERLTLSKSGTGTSLILHNKGLNQRSLTWRGHSILAINGIFFTPEQIAVAEVIFKQKGLVKGNI